MEKPKVFIGSSSEGIRIAESIKGILAKELDMTPWTDPGVFEPGCFYLEALEGALKSNTFAILVASPDDTLMKRGEISPTMRDNILFEFGLFAGMFGRKRAFLVIPDAREIAIPSDLKGLVIAKYKMEFLEKDRLQFDEAVKECCSHIQNVIKEQWDRMLSESKKAQEDARKSEICLASSRLLKASSKLQKAALAFQTIRLEKMADKQVFEGLKDDAIRSIDEIRGEYLADVQALGVESKFNDVISLSRAAVKEFPFPEEIAQIVESPISRIGGYIFDRVVEAMEGKKNFSETKASIQSDALSAYSGFIARYATWWSSFFPRLQRACIDLQDATQDVLFDHVYQLGKSSSSRL